MHDSHSPATTYLKVNGIGRDNEAPGGALVIYFNRKPTDDEMRRLHDVVREAVDDGLD